MIDEPMENFKQSLFYLVIVVSAFAAAVADPRIDDFDNENQVEYTYRYAVDESKSKGPVMDRWEQRIGEYVKGAYSVVEPDGRVRTVDYEVDGKKGYHAVIRMNDPSPDLLSYQQLQKSLEVYPESLLPAQVKTPSSNLSPPDLSSGKAWNYHSDARYVGNQPGSKSEIKPSETRLLSKASSPVARSLENLPLSPANFNVPQTTNVIYYETPAASIFHQTFHPLKSENFILRNVKREALFPIVLEQTKDPQSRRRRHSTLVKRYKSFSDVVS